jgi:RNA polymerase sigma factor (sigma-70 family)
MIPISKRYQDDINKHYKPITDVAMEKEYIRLAKAKSKSAADVLVYSQLKTVLSIARQYKNSLLEMDDLMTIGIVGIYKAIEKFEFEKETRFITYASSWIKAEISAEVHNNDLIRHPANVLIDIRKQEKAIRNGEIKESDVEILKYVVRSFGEPTTFQSKNTIQDYLGSIDEDLSKVDNMIGVDKILLTIDDLYGEKSKERKIFELLFGLNGEDIHTLDEVGKIIGLTKERIRQIKEKACDTIQKRLKIQI